MAPCSSFSTLHPTRTDRDPIKLRKPIVEKMRRDRINSCIEQLKVLLEKELHHEACPKLEKADVLEMTVCFLRQQLGQAHRVPHMEAWLRGSNTSPQPRDNPISNSNSNSSSSSSSSAPVWRPW